jgi:integrase/recombinase XerD
LTNATKAPEQQWGFLSFGTSGRLRTELLFGFDDPLFPATQVVVGDDGRFKSDGLVRKPWSNAGPIRRVSKEAFETAGLPAFNPHSLRKTLAQIGQKSCRTLEQMKAWSQNLGHEELMTTFASYGNLGRSQQADIMATLAKQMDTALPRSRDEARNVFSDA